MAVDSDDKEYAAGQIEAGAHLIPAYMVEPMRHYVLYGYQPGGFLTALLSNDLMGALSKADSENLASISNWGRFLYNYVPNGCFGSPQKVAAWLASFEAEAA